MILVSHFDSSTLTTFNSIQSVEGVQLLVCHSTTQSIPYSKTLEPYSQGDVIGPIPALGILPDILSVCPLLVLY
eukprot:scaffold14775_cov62-Cylindrotheca_fusiformis.AAC.2